MSAVSFQSSGTWCAYQLSPNVIQSRDPTMSPSYSGFVLYAICSFRPAIHAWRSSLPSPPIPLSDFPGSQLRLFEIFCPAEPGVNGRVTGDPSPIGAIMLGVVGRLKLASLLACLLPGRLKLLPRFGGLFRASSLKLGGSGRGAEAIVLTMGRPGPVDGLSLRSFWWKGDCSSCAG